MSITNWDEVLPAFDRAFEEMRKVTLQSKETALKYLKESGFLDPDEEEEKAYTPPSGLKAAAHYPLAP